MFNPNRITKAFFYTCEGLKSAWQSEQAFRDEIILILILTPTAYFVSSDYKSFIILLLPLLLILIVELLNSAVEKTVDLISLEKSTLAKQAKDIGSAAVFLSLLLAVLVWLAVLL